MGDQSEIVVPRRPNGTLKKFWYHDGHIYHRMDCGHIEAWNWYGCFHPAGEE